MIGSWTLSMASYIDTAGANGDGAMHAADLHPGADDAQAQGVHRGLPEEVQHRPHAFAGVRRAGLRLGLSAGRRHQAGQAPPTGRKIREALENLNDKIEGVVTIYDKPFTATDHEAITGNIPVMGLVKGGRVVPAHPEDIAGRQGCARQEKELIAISSSANRRAAGTIAVLE